MFKLIWKWFHSYFHPLFNFFPFPYLLHYFPRIPFLFVSVQNDKTRNYQNGCFSVYFHPYYKYFYNCLIAVSLVNRAFCHLASLLKTSLLTHNPHSRKGTEDEHGILVCVFSYAYYSVPSQSSTPIFNNDRHYTISILQKFSSAQVGQHS